MRHILQAFTMFVNGKDFGYETEEVELPLPVPKEQTYNPGGVDLEVNLQMGKIEALEATVKISGTSPDLLSLCGKGPGQTDRFTFRGSVLSEINGGYVPHVCIIEGALNGGSRDRWQRGEKSGLELMIKGIVYFRYEVGSDEVLHELQLYPPKRIVNGVDHLKDINQHLGVPQ